MDGKECWIDGNGVNLKTKINVQQENQNKMKTRAVDARWSFSIQK